MDKIHQLWFWVVNSDQMNQILIVLLYKGDYETETETEWLRKWKS